MRGGWSAFVRGAMFAVVYLNHYATEKSGAGIAPHKQIPPPPPRRRAARGCAARDPHFFSLSPSASQNLAGLHTYRVMYVKARVSLPSSRRRKWYRAPRVEPAAVVDGAVDIARFRCRRPASARRELVKPRRVREVEWTRAKVSL